jgi:hypothetical protein
LLQIFKNYVTDIASGWISAAQQASGFLVPLLYLSGRRWDFLTPNVVVGGLVAALVLLVGYFVDELVHYRLIFPIRFDLRERRREGPVRILLLAMATLLGVAALLGW